MDAISKLPEKEKMVVSLYYFEDLTLKEISAIMKVSSHGFRSFTQRQFAPSGKLARHKSIQGLMRYEKKGGFDMDNQSNLFGGLTGSEGNIKFNYFRGIA